MPLLPPWMPTLVMTASLAQATPLPTPAPAEPAAPAPPSSAKPASKDMSPKTVGRDQALEVVLDSGLRVRIARDRTLPVAAVILAIETGPEDDPAEYPGLTHALAYQLLQGNRELRPGEAVEIVHGGGGVASLAVGHAQVRFESVVPASRLAQTLWIESERLRFPTTRASTWKQSLGWAQADPAQPSVLRPDARAAVHRAPGLARDGRRPGEPLREMSEAILAVQLRSRFDYARATLVVVAPEEPAAVLAMIEPLFADLPRSPRRVAARLPGARAKSSAAAQGGSAGPGTGAGGSTGGPGGAPGEAPASAPGAGAGDAAALGAGASAPGGAAATPETAANAPGGGPAATPEKTATNAPGGGPATTSASPGVATDPSPSPPPGEGAAEPPSVPMPETVLAGNHRGPLLAWSIPGTPEASLWAEAVCRALGRQRRVADEPRPLKVSCVVDADPRRAALLVQVTGTEDLVGAATARLQRLQGGRDQGLLAAQASVLAGEQRIARTRPLELARQLAAAAEPAGATAPEARDLDVVTGVAALTDPAELPRVFPSIVDCGGAVLLIRPEAPKP